MGRLPNVCFQVGTADSDNEYYVHRTRVVFPTHRPLTVHLQRPCPGVGPSHRHVALKGCREGTRVTRCTEAGAYARDFITGVVGILQATLVGGGTVFPTTVEEQRELESFPAREDPMEAIVDAAGPVVKGSRLVVCAPSAGHKGLGGNPSM